MATKIRPINLHTTVDTHVQGLIDSSYIQARTAAGTDSASTQAMIDSNFANNITFGGDISIADSKVINIGGGNDLRIFHNPNNSVIQEQGSGSLFIDASNLNLRNAAGSKTYAAFTDGGAAELNHNNSKKIETTDSGGKITGNISANIRSNPKSVSLAHTVDSNSNALLVGPINVDSGITLTINGTLMVV